LDLGEMWAHPQLQALGLAQPVDHPERPAARVIGQPLTFADQPAYRGVRRAAPAQGEHTDAILGELGVDGSEIERLRADGVV
jgi:crotonobetainyl-CoA:carnitine CoA-transferase CaiB-like acyl-CoA transferase